MIFLLIRLVEFYPIDFSSNGILYLADEFNSYIYNIHHDNEFLGLKGIGVLTEKMISKKNISYIIWFIYLSSWY